MSDSPIEITLGDDVTAAVIWLHGLGADGNDFVPVVPELGLPSTAGIRFVFPHAPVRPVTCNGGYAMRAWYDIYSLDSLTQEDEAGLQESQRIIEELIAQQTAQGIDTSRILLMGFSQGGAVALYTGLRHAGRLAGIGALSTYLPLFEKTAVQMHATNADTPVFMAHGSADPIVRCQLGARSRDRLHELGIPTEWHEYPMEHSVCIEEIRDIGHWISTRLLADQQDDKLCRDRID